jgi:hypothetical protein
MARSNTVLPAGKRECSRICKPHSSISELRSSIQIARTFACFDAPAMLQQLLDLFEFEIHGLRKASPYPYVSEKAHNHVHKKSGTGSKHMHHGQESGTDDEVAGPVCCCCQTRAHASHGKTKKFALLPWNTAQSTCVRGHIEDE